jgi:hypothetical protein
MEEGWSLRRGGVAWGYQNKGVRRSNGIITLETKSHGSCTCHLVKSVVVDLVIVPVTSPQQGMENIGWREKCALLKIWVDLDVEAFSALFFFFLLIWGLCMVI